MTTTNDTAYVNLVKPFDPKEVKSFNGAKPGKPERWLSYVPDETVMGRLDDVLGPGNWTVDVDVIDVAKSIVKVTLAVRWPENNAFLSYSDFGYPTNDFGEGLKEASGDGLRRVARYLGIARYVYAGEVQAQAPAGHRPPPRQPSAPPSGDWAAEAAADVDRQADDESMCQRHHVAWGGTPYDPGNDRSGRYHKDGVWEDSGKTKWCRHPADEAAKKGNR